MASISLVQDTLHASEEVKVTLETLTIQPANSSDVEPTSPLNNQITHVSGHRKRILAVISHRNLDGLEEGSIFVCKTKPVGYGLPDELAIQRVFPITEAFSMTTAQTKLQAPDVHSNLSGSDQNQTRSGFILTINSGEQKSEPLKLSTYDVQGLRSLLGEYKRIKESYNPELDGLVGSTTKFRWLLHYASNLQPLPTLTRTPQDLRIVQQPLHNRLSPSCAGLPGDDILDFQLIRDAWIRKKARELSRKGRRRLSMRLGTFNVNGKLPSQDLSTWIRGTTTSIHSDEAASLTIPPLRNMSPISLGGIVQSPTNSTGTGSSESQSAGDIHAEPVDPDVEPDILVFGFQELDLSTEALLYSTTTTREDAWCKAIFAALGGKASMYEKLVSAQLVGMLLVIIVKASLKSCFNNVRTCVAGAGIMGVLGNKGATAIRLEFTPPTPIESDIKSPGPTAFTIVNAHLAAYDEMAEKRNADFLELSRRLTVESRTPRPDMPLPEPLSVYESDALFWMVYLNYRIDDIPAQDVRSILASEEWHDKFGSLLEYDQLKKAMRANKAFEGFHEHPITHLPTYRFSPGLQMDKLGYDLKRKPAWTDRILHLAGTFVGVQQLSYTSHPLITMSDHRPVAADFSITIDLYNKGHEDSSARKIYRELEASEDSEDRRVVKLDATSIDLGKISYKRHMSRTLSVQNTGKVPCAYRFIPSESGAQIHPDWLSLEPMTGFLLPNETTTIILSAYVDDDSASRLNLSPKHLDVTLILHTVMGKDHFISVSGEYQYTCFANKLSRLIRLPGPVRSLSSPDDLLRENSGINAPREIMRLVNWMMTDKANVDGLFASPANAITVETIRECLDTGADFPFNAASSDPQVPLAFSAVLLQLLSSLTSPVVPASLHAKCTEVSSRDEAFELLDEFPSSSVNVWITLTAFLHFISQKPVNQSQKAEKIATIFAPILLRDDPSSAYPLISPVGKRNFLLYFIS